MESINYLAVVVAAMAVFGLGSLWYTPILFGNAWMKESASHGPTSPSTRAM